MAIIKQGDKDDYQYKYKVRSAKEIHNQLTQFTDIIGIYLDTVAGLDVEDIACDFIALSEMMVRIDKRKDYFQIFHDRTDMNEIKEAALLAYWLIKFRPYTVKNEFKSRNHRNINETFAIFILLSAVKEETNRVEKKRFHISAEYIKRLAYAFRYWDVSKEAMMLVAESLSEGMWV